MDLVVIMDDGGSDAISERAEAAGAYVVRHQWNGGFGAALQTIFETARDLGADRMVIIDSDGQHDPDEIPKLLQDMEVRRQLSINLTLLMILLTLVGSFMAFTGIILHVISRLIDRSLMRPRVEPFHSGKLTSEY
ncbi:glycosyltransferase [Methanothrix sp.]|uniref:glycosyltransferase n=1 Tax=Methanothrix sp. TaxID=90426 RepID=UPI003BB76A22